MKNHRGRPRSSRTRLDGSRDRIIKKYVEDGESVRKLAAKLEVCPLTFRLWLKDNGITPRGMIEEGDARRRKFLEARRETDAEIFRLRVGEGLEIQDIKDRLGVSVTRIYAALRDAGVVRLSENAGLTTPKPKPARGQARLAARRAKVLAAIGQGLSSRQLAKRFGVSKSSVLRWTETENIRLLNLTELQKRIVALWKSSDLNMKAVAACLSCGRTTVAATLRKAGLIDHRTTAGRPPGSVRGKRSAIHRQRQADEPCPAARPGLP